MSPRGGPRPDSGRPRKLNKHEYTNLHVTLRKSVVERLKAAANSRFVGQYLEEIIEKHLQEIEQRT